MVSLCNLASQKSASRFNNKAIQAVLTVIVQRQSSQPLFTWLNTQTATRRAWHFGGEVLGEPRFCDVIVLVCALTLLMGVFFADHSDRNTLQQRGQSKRVTQGTTAHQRSMSVWLHFC
jgi:hypothetical protein